MADKGGFCPACGQPVFVCSCLLDQEQIRQLCGPYERLYKPMGHICESLNVLRAYPGDLSEAISHLIDAREAIQEFIDQKRDLWRDLEARIPAEGG